MSSSMWFDIFIIGFTLILGLKGLINGLIKEFFGLLGLALGVFLASKYAENLSLFINENIYEIQNEDITQLIAFLAILIIIWVICLILGNIISKIIALTDFKLIDRIGGFVFSSAKVFLILAILFFCVNRIEFLSIKIADFAEQSHTLTYLKGLGDWVMNAEIVDGVKDLTQDLQENTQGEVQ